MTFVSSCGEPALRDDQRTHSSRSASADAWQEELDAMTAGACDKAPTLALAPSTHTITVDASDAWTSSEFFVTRGTAVDITADGNWTTWRDVNPPTDAAGDARLTTQEGCARGSLVARVGLGGNDGKTLCVSKARRIVADTDGILYLGMNDNSPAMLHAGSMTVTVTTTAMEAPTVAAADVATYAFCSVPSGWVELQTAEFLTLTTPAALAAKHRSTLAASLARLDGIVGTQSRLAAGAAPSGGHRARFFPDPSVRGTAWIVAGNPLRIDPRLLSKQEPSRISLLAIDDDEAELFDVVRALGVNMSRHSGGRYQPDDKAAQAWGGLFAQFAHEDRSIGRWPGDPCATADAHIAGGSESAWLNDSNLQLCTLLRIKEAAGWQVFASFFASIPAPDAWDTAIKSGSGASAAWRWVMTTLDNAAPGIVAPVATEMHAPAP